MDPRIWSRLPEHLLERVLSFLPLKTFLSLRSTCKTFNSLLFSPCFISKHSNLSNFSSFILLSHPQFLPKCPLFNTVLNSWSPPMLSCLPSPNLLSSSNGILCFSVPDSTSFIICNLLNRSVRRVRFPTLPFNFEMLTLVSTPNGCKLFMISSSNVLVYDSKANSWRWHEGFDLIRNNEYHQTGILYQGCLYFTTPEPFSVVGFNLESGQWETSPSGMRLPGGLTFARLVGDSEGRKLYLVGGVGASGISRSVKLWELSGAEDQTTYDANAESRNWEEVETLPEMVCRKFLSVCYHNYEHVYCFWHEGLICVCCYTWPEILYYKVSRRTWHWLPKCPSLPHKWSCGFRWFSFKPQLYAIV